MGPLIRLQQRAEQHRCNLSHDLSVGGLQGPLHALEDIEVGGKERGMTLAFE